MIGFYEWLVIVALIGVGFGIYGGFRHEPMWFWPLVAGVVSLVLYSLLTAMGVIVL